RQSRALSHQEREVGLRGNHARLSPLPLLLRPLPLPPIPLTPPRLPLFPNQVSVSQGYGFGYGFGEITPDYLLSPSSCALFLSLRYHLLHPDYLYFRIRELQKSFRLRIVLCHVDVDDVTKPLHDITETAGSHGSFGKEGM
ncbi:unnamed protein product, partial [Closterium sp. Naga37s-1]